MKTFFIYLLSISLLVAILAPSILTVLELGDKSQIVMDLNEEEEKQETTEFLETEFFLISYNHDFSFPIPQNSLVFKNNIESFSSSNTEVSLPPPKS
ncbi:hypothetical protein PP182_04970 [Maribacter sp. PR1]|uniref:Uncharacterized protein n=1 Tax=Maribacter cobaltidurans TaxID=1178778 RepID=A0ABU7IR12_9FLAO|nr:MULTISPECIES: hypothetical protein [Maribacter]MDC6388019.1 hypothetical protein [Maribacter sp. PR1]MEE1975407.1 hypothetical protein [Maribacter cobaltidurans]